MESGSGSAQPADDTADLWSRAGRGDRAAVDELVARHHDWVRARVHGHLGTPMRRDRDTMDVVQEILLRVLRRAQPAWLPNAPALRAYLLKVVRRELSSRSIYHGRQRRSPEREVPLDTAILEGQAGPVGRTATGPLDRAERAELAAVAEAALELLDGPKQAVIRMRIDAVPPDEIARALGIARASVDKTWARAVAGWRRKFEVLLARGLEDLVSGSAQDADGGDT